MRGEHLQHRQREAGGLAGAGLRAAHDVAAREDRRNRLAWIGVGFGVTLIGTARSSSGIRFREAKDILAETDSERSGRSAVALEIASAPRVVVKVVSQGLWIRR